MRRVLFPLNRARSGPVEADLLHVEADETHLLGVEQLEPWVGDCGEL
jgi:hypothetical protein